ncbi:MAG: ATP-binding cassette domain-containing protein [Oscillospiraceae bacterium]|nr:ATP-binding cassette domain-containing protein [Oscillospiraceae bacterium]
MLTLEHIHTAFHRGTVDEMKLFEDFSFRVNKGDFISIVGSNGSGKTTLLNLICGTLQPDAGKILLRDKDITHLPEFKRAKYIGRVFQDPKAGTCSNLTVLENFALADNKGKPFALGRAVNKKRIDYYKELLSKCGMGLEDRLNTPIGNLSGGQRQAIALVLTGMTDVDLLILDEHTAALDPKSSETIMELTDQLVKEHDLTAVMVTHNLRFAVEYGNRLVMMHDGKAIIDKSGEEKKALQVTDLLETFNQISIECGN